MIDDLNTHFHAGSHFLPLGPPRQGGMIFFSSDRLASWFGKKLPKRATNLKKNRGDQLKKGGASERGSILWHWALLSRGECQTHMITLISLAVTGWNLLPIDLEERRWPKRAANLEKMRGWSFENKRWCLSGKEVPSCDTGPSSAGGGPNTHNKIVFFQQWVTGCNLLLVPIPHAIYHATSYIPYNMTPSYSIQSHTRYVAII